MYEISIKPSFAIGEKAYLISHSEGNILWECFPFLDGHQLLLISKLGGLKPIAISNSHYYSLGAEWP